MKWLTSRTGKFLLKALCIYLIWYVIYELWLLPEGSLDEWLTTNIVSVSAGILTYLGYHIYAIGRLIGIGLAPGIYLANGCSGTSVMGLFAGFVIAYPGKWIPRLVFIPTGFGIIYLANVARIVVLAIIQTDWPGFFGIAHTYSTKALLYLIVFGLWVLWATYGKGQPLNPQAESKRTV